MSECWRSHSRCDTAFLLPEHHGERIRNRCYFRGGSHGALRQRESFIQLFAFVGEDHGEIVQCDWQIRRGLDCPTIQGFGFVAFSQ